MPNPTSGIVYPFDPTGRLLSNKITNEQQILTAVNFRDFSFIVPRFAPFFEEGLSLRIVETNGNVRPLVKGQDYYLSHIFHDASRACAAPIYGSITMLNNQLQGQVIIEQYQTLGGMWTIDEQKILEILGDKIRNPRTTVWEQVVDLPIRFPPIDHEWDIVDMYGAQSIVEAIGGVENAVRQASVSGLNAHIARVDNPHMTTAEQLGLGLVQNFGTASIQECIDGVANNLYVTPAGLRAAMAAFLAAQQP